MSRTVTKKELVARVAEQVGITKVVAKDVIRSFLDEIVTELARDNRIEFRDFGVFEVRERAERKAQNPRTMEQVVVPARKTVKFKVGRVMRERVGGSEEPQPDRGATPASRRETTAGVPARVLPGQSAGGAAAEGA